MVILSCHPFNAHKAKIGILNFWQLAYNRHNCEAHWSTILFVLQILEETQCVSCRLLASLGICTLTLPYEWDVTQNRWWALITRVCSESKILCLISGPVKVRMMMMMVAFPILAATVIIVIFKEPQGVKYGLVRNCREISIILLHILTKESLRWHHQRELQTVCKRQRRRDKDLFQKQVFQPTRISQSLHLLWK